MQNSTGPRMVLAVTTTVVIIIIVYLMYVWNVFLLLFMFLIFCTFFRTGTDPKFVSEEEVDGFSFPLHSLPSFPPILSPAIFHPFPFQSFSPSRSAAIPYLPFPMQPHSPYREAAHIAL